MPHLNPAVRAPGHARSAGADWHNIGGDGEAGLSNPPVSGIEDQGGGPVVSL